VHMLLCSYPQKIWADVLLELRALHLEPTSPERIATNIQAPQALESLLNELRAQLLAAS
jgi:hypothetical protein